MDLDYDDHDDSPVEESSGMEVDDNVGMTLDNDDQSSAGSEGSIHDEGKNGRPAKGGPHEIEIECMI
jgi:hypothetical protein